MGNAVLISIYSQRWGPREELGVEYVAAAIENTGRSVEIVLVADDGITGAEELEASLLTLKPTLVAVGCSHCAIDLESYKKLSTIVRNILPKTHITCGGYFATFNAKKLLDDWEELDSVIAGEGEHTATNLISILEHSESIDDCLGVITRTNFLKPRPVIQNLDELPYPRRQVKGLPRSNLFPISTSRGCMAHCTFCNVPRWTKEYGGGWRGRSPRHIADEIQKLYSENDARRFWIVDSSYEDPYPEGFARIQAIADEIILRELPISYYVFFRAESLVRKNCQNVIQHLILSGLRRVFIGIESGTDEELKYYGKKANLEESKQALRFLKGLGLTVRTGFIMFNPYSTVETLRSNLEFMKSEGFLDSTADLMTRLELYTGSVELTRLKKNHLLIDDPWNKPYAYRFLNPRIEAPANALNSLRDLNNPEHRWESIHTAKLVASGALHTLPVIEHDFMHERALVLKRDIDEMSDTLAQANEAFFLEIIEMAEVSWSEIRFKELVETYIDGYQSQIGATCDALVQAFLLEARKHKIDVIF
jgi:anaerobic magnesium-protoporphyrin IX monomethyl ester cyclase